MRVLMLSWEYPPHIVGGLGRHVTELVPALARQGVEVEVVTPRWAGGEAREASPSGAVIHRVDPPDVGLADIFTSAWQTNTRLAEFAAPLVRPDPAGSSSRCRADILHAHDWLVSFAAVALKTNFHIPLLATIHATERGRGHGYLGSDMSRAIHNAEWWLTFEAWRVICCSGYMASEVMGFFHVPPDKLDVIPNGVDTSVFDALDEEDLSYFRTMYALPDERIVFYVGRVVHEKGLHILVEAVPKVLSEHPEAKFVIAGTGGMLEALRRRAWELGVGPKVLFTGYIPDEARNRLYKVADVAVFPSLYEPFGIVALEAMAARTPVVASDVGGLHEVVKHGET
ncbi:MAG: glycosyltransferase family 4 protein, partial [Chloroflexi bacterium]|nr:glycosyltransferase family 4 protein [Chloroflexota bacterium]